MRDQVSDGAGTEPQKPVSRRTFLGMAAGAAIGLPALAASRGSTGSWTSSWAGDEEAEASKPLKFWNMPWGNTYFNKLDQQIVQAYKPAKGLPQAQYQVIEWANYLQTFSSAVASNTGPAVSSGGGTQAFLFAHQGFIEYADELIDSWKSNGLYHDFLPGVLDTMKTKNGYAAIPYNLDMRVGWYSPSLLQKAGVSQPPTDWQSYLDACAALKKIGVYGYGVGSATGEGSGSQSMVGFMINNGGGLFNKDQQPDCLSKENVEAIEFVVEMVRKGYVDPGSPEYTSANVYTQWAAGKFGMGYDTAGLGEDVGGTVGPALQIANPLVGATGKKGAIYFPNNIMMYKNTPSKKDSQAFLTYYYKNMHQLWTQNTGIGLPVLKSITETAAFKASATNVKVIKEWQPISHTWAWPGSDSLFYGVTSVDGTQLLTTWAQSVLGGKVGAKESLSTLQSAIKSQMAANS